MIGIEVRLLGTSLLDLRFGRIQDEVPKGDVFAWHDGAPLSFDETLELLSSAETKSDELDDDRSTLAGWPEEDNE